jgi:hypothetical protein
VRGSNKDYGEAWSLLDILVKNTRVVERELMYLGCALYLSSLVDRLVDRIRT